MNLKRPKDVDAMADAAVINREALEAVEAALAPGVTTAALDAVAEEAIVSRGGTPAFKGYRGFPATLCTSVNEVVVHGIPDDRPLRDGDIVSIDIGTFYRGYAADQAMTYAVGTVPQKVADMLAATEASLWAGIEAMVPGNRLGDVSAAIQDVVERAGFWVVREFVGHGIGRTFHEAPDVPNYGRPGTGPVLRPGLVLAIEPMVTLSPTAVVVAEDGWTAPTETGVPAAHFEHTVAVSEDGPRILTAKEPISQARSRQGVEHGA